LHPRIPRLGELGVIEQAARGRYVLSRKYYTATGKKGVYTRKIGLARETNKELLLKHLRDNVQDGSRLEELCQVLPGRSRAQVQGLLRDLKKEGKARLVGITRAGKWFIVSDG
jgi:ATP-dependent DNA helicase RecG